MQKIESIGLLAGGVALDFNNMLGIILGRAELALMTADPSSPFLSFPLLSFRILKKFARQPNIPLN